MPYLDGFAVMRQTGPMVAPGSYLPILVLTADITPEAKQKALSLSAKDFLTKPFDRTEVLLRIHNLLETRLLHLQLQNQNRTLETKVAERTRDLQEAHIETLERLAQAAEFRDDNTGEHTRRMGQHRHTVAIPIVIFTAKDLNKQDLRRIDGQVQAVTFKSAKENLLTELERVLGRSALSEVRKI